MNTKEELETWIERFEKARKKDKRVMFDEKIKEINKMTDDFLDKADDILLEETSDDRLFFVEERDFTEKMDNFLKENFEQLLGLKDINEDEHYRRLQENIKLVIVMETTSGSEIPLICMIAYPEKDENGKDCLRINMLPFSIPKKYRHNSPLEIINKFIESETFKDFMTEPDIFEFISANALIRLMYDIVHPNPSDQILFNFSLDTIQEVMHSKDVIVARNALRTVITLNTIPFDMQEFLNEHFKGAYDVSVTNRDITISTKNSDEIYIALDQERLNIDSTMSRKRTDQIINEVYQEICDYRMTNIVLYDYMSEIEKIGKERGIITKDGTKVNIEIQKFRNEFFESFLEDEKRDVPMDKLIDIMDEYIFKHPETLEFIEPENAN